MAQEVPEDLGVRTSHSHSGATVAATGAATGGHQMGMVVAVEAVAAQGDLVGAAPATMTTTQTMETRWAALCIHVKTPLYIVSAVLRAHGSQAFIMT